MNQQKIVDSAASEDMVTVVCNGRMVKVPKNQEQETLERLSERDELEYFDDFDDGCEDNPPETFEQYECDYDDEELENLPFHFVPGKIEIYRRGDFMALDIKTNPLYRSDMLTVYTLVCADSFEYVGEHEGYLCFAPKKFNDKPTAFREQYLGWMAMDIQAQALQAAREF